MRQCLTCAAKTGGQAISNAGRTISLDVPEEHFGLFRKLFFEMSTRLGMYGFGDLANAISPYRELFMEDFDKLRFFDDAALSMVMIGISKGHQATVRRGPERPAMGFINEPRLSVHVDFEFGDHDIRSIRVAENATVSAADWFVSYFLDAVQRFGGDSNHPE